MARARVFAFHDLQIDTFGWNIERELDWDDGVAAPERGYTISAKLRIYILDYHHNLSYRQSLGAFWIYFISEMLDGNS